MDADPDGHPADHTRSLSASEQEARQAFSQEWLNQATKGFRRTEAGLLTRGQGPPTLTPEERDALRLKFDAEIAKRIQQYGWPSTLSDQKRLKLSTQAEAELDALRKLQERQSRLREDEEVVERVRDAANYVRETDRFKRLRIEEILEDEEPDDPDEAWDWDPTSRAQELERERICIWCGKVLETLELLEKHEIECE
jgi:hypothetical protein